MIGITIDISPDRTEYDNAMAAVREGLGEGKWGIEFARGKAMSLDDAVAYALEKGESKE
jgi:hypothetical protein